MYLSRIIRRQIAAFATRLHGVRHTVAWLSPHGCVRSPHGCRMWIIYIVYNFAVEGRRQVLSAAVPTILKKSKKAINHALSLFFFVTLQLTSRRYVVPAV